jgi:hypothetical protein
LPDSEVIVTFDGVRAEQEDRRADYDEFTRRMLWLLDKKYQPALPFIWDEHLHQVGMLRRVVPEVRTPLLMFVEQDTPLETAEFIAWPTIIEFIIGGHTNLVRFSHESEILECHQHLMCGTDWNGLFTRTAQFSARPHVATTAFYRRLLDTCFSPEACCYTEDVLHGVCHEAYKLGGIEGWRQYAMHLYTPPGNIRRSYHTDGRAGEPKFDSLQRF